MKLSVLIVGLIFVNVLLYGYGSVLYQGINAYGVSNSSIDFRLFNQTDSLYNTINSNFMNMTNASIESTPTLFGTYYYIGGVVGTVFNVLLMYPAYATNFLTSLLTAGLVVLPDWLAWLLGVLMMIAFLFGLVNVFTPREV